MHNQLAQDDSFESGQNKYFASMSQESVAAL